MSRGGGASKEKVQKVIGESVCLRGEETLRRTTAKGGEVLEGVRDVWELERDPT